MRRSTSAQSIMADKQQQQQQQQQLALTVSTSTLSITSIADYAEQVAGWERWLCEAMSRLVQVHQCVVGAW